MEVIVRDHGPRPQTLVACLYCGARMPLIRAAGQCGGGLPGSLGRIWRVLGVSKEACNRASNLRAQQNASMDWKSGFSCLRYEYL
jgi:hypothetical protein